MKLFRPPNFFKLFEQFQKLVAFLLPIFGNVDGSWRVTSKLMYEVSRLSKLREDARRCSKDFQQVWYELEMFKVCRDDMPCEIKKNPNMGFFWGGGEKVEKFIGIIFFVQYMYRDTCKNKQRKINQ